MERDKIAEIAEKIRVERQKKGISQEAMAYDLGISQPHYSKWERGERQIPSDQLSDIADILEISVVAIMPKSKYGTGINLFGLKEAWRKVKVFFGSGKR